MRSKSISFDMALRCVQNLHCGKFIELLYCLSSVCPCALNARCVVTASEYLMKPWRALHCCSYGHGVSGKALPLSGSAICWNQ